MSGFLELHNLRKIVADPSVQKPWVRSELYLALPAVHETDQIFAGLYAVFPVGGCVAFRCSGNFKVDWGDGTTALYWSGQAAEHSYDFSKLPNNTLDDRGFKQVIIQITPQNGQDLTSIDLNVKHSSAVGPASLMTGWTDIEINAPRLTNLQIGGSWSAIKHRLLEQFALTNSAISNFSYFFNQCSALRKVVALETTATVTSVEGMYRDCHTLDEISEFDIGTSTSFRYMFENCYKLKSVPALNYTRITNASYMFSGCVSLVDVPEITCAKVTDASYMFNGCTNLGQILGIGMPKLSNTSNMFLDCVSLRKVTLAGVVTNVDLSDAKLSLNELVSLFKSLGSTSGKIINVSGSWGSAALTEAQRNIAHNKGWTIIG